MSDAERTEHRARSMGFVFQSFNLIPVFTAVENVELPLLLVGTPAKQRPRRRPSRCWRRSASPTARTTCPTRCPAASSSG